MKKALIAAILALTSATTLLARAEEAPAPAPATPLQTRAPKPLTLVQDKVQGTPIGYKLLAGGVVIVAAGVWLKKKKGISLKKGGKAKKKSDIDVLARASIGVRNELIVVEVEGTRLLVGMTSGSMQTLAVLQTPEGVTGEESPELPGEFKYRDATDSAVTEVPRVKTLREQLEEPEEQEEEEVASTEAQQLSHRVRSLLDARKKNAKTLVSEPPPPPVIQPSPAPVQQLRRPQQVAAAAAPQAKANVPGQAKGLLLSMSEGARDNQINTRDW